MSTYGADVCSICGGTITANELVSGPCWHHRDLSICQEAIRADEREKKMAVADIAFLDAMNAREELEMLRAEIASSELIEASTDEHDPLCLHHPDWGLMDSPCRCMWIRIGRSDVLAKINEAAMRAEMQERATTVPREDAPDGR